MVLWIARLQNGGRQWRWALTYNFDPERWYDIESATLEKALHAGTLDREVYDAALEALQQKLEALWDTLDGSYRLPA